MEKYYYRKLFEWVGLLIQISVIVVGLLYYFFIYH